MLGRGSKESQSTLWDDKFKIKYITGYIIDPISMFGKTKQTNKNQIQQALDDSVCMGFAGITSGMRIVINRACGMPEPPTDHEGPRHRGVASLPVTSSTTCRAMDTSCLTSLHLLQVLNLMAPPDSPKWPLGDISRLKANVIG